MSQKSTIPPNIVWDINGIKLELDMSDVDNQERYENAFARLGETEKNLPKDGKNSERTRAYCQMFRSLYDDIFGEGTSQKIFGDVNNARIMTEVYELFLEFIQNQGEQLNQTRSRVLDRFSPNRAQRRAQAKGKK